MPSNMPFHDLNVVYSTEHAKLATSLAFFSELGYSVVALAVSITGKLPATLPTVEFDQFRGSQFPKALSRLTFTISDHTQNHRVNSLTTTYDIVALRPTNDKAFQLCCSSLDCDIISLDFTQRIQFPIKFKTVASALQRGIRFEICYSGGITGGSDATRNLISGAGALIRATRGRGIIVSSEASTALGLRAPSDVINLATVWGLSQERGRESVCDEAARIVRLAGMKRTSYRGVVDVVEDGTHDIPLETQKADATDLAERANLPVQVPSPASHISPLPLKQVTVVPDKTPNPEKAKRKASMASLNDRSTESRSNNDSKPLSNREMKRLAKKARLDRAAGKEEGQKLPSQQTKEIKSKSNTFPIQHEALSAKKKKG